MPSPTKRRTPPEPKHDGGGYRVFGAIRDELQTPLVDTVVKAFDKEIRNKAVAWQPRQQGYVRKLSDRRADSTKDQSVYRYAFAFPAFRGTGKSRSSPSSYIRIGK
jgi:hypothetical protein